MWSHYSDLHRGISIDFNEEKMRQSSFFGRGGLVKYDDKFPVINPLDGDLFENNIHLIYTKAKDWNYEQEYRLAKFNFPNELSLSDRLVKLPTEFIDEVNLGLKIPSNHKDEIMEFCFANQIKTFQIKKTPFAFQLDRSLIQ